jgi:hypothetical protein
MGLIRFIVVICLGALIAGCASQSPATPMPTPSAVRTTTPTVVTPSRPPQPTPTLSPEGWATGQAIIDHFDARAYTVYDLAGQTRMSKVDLMACSSVPIGDQAEDCAIVTVWEPYDRPAHVLIDAHLGPVARAAVVDVVTLLDPKESDWATSLLSGGGYGSHVSELGQILVDGCETHAVLNAVPAGLFEQPIPSPDVCIGGADIGRVIYRLTGTATSADITYTDGAGNIQQQTGIGVPLHSTTGLDGLRVGGNAGYYVFSAQNRGASGNLSCSIERNGRVYNTGFASGGYAIVECSASIP